MKEKHHNTREKEGRWTGPREIASVLVSLETCMHNGVAFCRRLRKGRIFITPFLCLTALGIPLKYGLQRCIITGPSTVYEKLTNQLATARAATDIIQRDGTHDGKSFQICSKGQTFREGRCSCYGGEMMYEWRGLGRGVKGTVVLLYAKVERPYLSGKKSDFNVNPTNARQQTSRSGSASKR